MNDDSPKADWLILESTISNRHLSGTAWHYILKLIWRSFTFNLCAVSYLNCGRKLGGHHSMINCFLRNLFNSILSYFSCGQICPGTLVGDYNKVKYIYIYNLELLFSELSVHNSWLFDNTIYKLPTHMHM